MERKIVVVTGATGHLGNNVIRELIDNGYIVRALIYPGCTIGKESLKDLQVEVFLGDILNIPSLEKAFEGADYVVHLAGIISIDGDKEGLVTRTNQVGTANVADTCLNKKIKRLIHMSSIHVYDFLDYRKPISEDTRFSSRELHGFYAYSKVLAEQEIRKRIEKGLDSIILNPSGIIGPNDFEPSRMGQFFLDIFYKRYPVVINGGFHYVDARDIGKTIINSFSKGRIGESYILSQSFYSIKDLYEICHEITGLSIPKFELPLFMAYLGIPFDKLKSKLLKREASVTTESLAALKTMAELNNTKAINELSFQPRKIEDTLRDIYIWFIRNNFIDLMSQTDLIKERCGQLIDREKEVYLKAG